jgi:hypothetical protein
MPDGVIPPKREYHIVRGTVQEELTVRMWAGILRAKENEYGKRE